MKKITIEEMDVLIESGEYTAEQCLITAKNMDKAKLYIERLRELHNRLGCFIRYTCLCSTLSGAVAWRILYRIDEYERLDINTQTDAIWNSIFPEHIATNEVSSGNPMLNKPCVCPFSGE